ncbi:universal stress protein [Nonomuraea rubra]|uniref:universal stress protein n=1 Tax=Nonomuraea rubra TaxID=46180 RepID=UPI0033CAFB83
MRCRAGRRRWKPAGLAEVAAWMREGGRSVLAATAEEQARGDQPKISVRASFLPDDPRTALIEAARDAELLVVGSHGHGTFAGMVPGSVSHALLHHAPCPLAVARTAR